MNDWERFRADVPWAFRQQAEIAARAKCPASELITIEDRSREYFPNLTSLFEDAFVTAASVDGEEQWLVTWPSNGACRGWVCLPPASAGAQFLSEHASLLSMFGGIGERWNEPEDTWLLNLNGALRVQDTKEPVWIEDWSWKFEDAGMTCPIPLEDYLAFAHEANGNTTMYHRDTGAVILWAPDHSFDHVKPLEGCPEYTLYTIPDAPTFVDWVEMVAVQWKRAM